MARDFWSKTLMHQDRGRLECCNRSPSTVDTREVQFGGDGRHADLAAGVAARSAVKIDSLEGTGN